MSEYAALIGIDWADQKHDICLIDLSCDKHEAAVLRHSPQSLDEWARGLQARFAGRQIAVCLEQSRGPLIYALMKYDFLTLYPVNPSTLARYREAFSPSRHKDDASDAAYLAELLRCTASGCAPGNPMRSRRARFVTWSSIAAAWLRPHAHQQPPDRALEVLLPAGSPLVPFNPHHSGLRLPPALAVAVCAPEGQARDALAVLPRAQLGQERGPREESRGDQRGSPAGDRPGRDRLINADGQGACLPDADDALSYPEFDTEIAALCAVNEDCALLQSLPGAGPNYAARLTVALGTDSGRWQSADEVAQLSGIAPVIERSGKTCRVRWRYFCPKFLRQTFHEYAGESIRHSFWARAYYDRQRAKGKSHQAAVRALAFKWIRIIYRCWMTRTAYDEVKYLEGCARKALRYSTMRRRIRLEGETLLDSSTSDGLFYERAVKRKHLSSGWLSVVWQPTPTQTSLRALLRHRCLLSFSSLSPALLRHSWASLAVIRVDANRLFYLRLCLAYCYLRLCAGAYG